MANEHIHELTWDYLYGLLDQTESESLRAHVEICPQCRSALAEAEGQQQMLARAARAVHEVPAFTLPGQDQEPAAANIPTGVAPSAATTALPAPLPRRSALRRYWPVWAAAAAFLGVAVGVEVYQNGLSRHEARIAKLRKQVETADGFFAMLRANVDKEKRDTARLLREQNPPQLNVLAPARVHPGTPANIRVATRDLDGKPRDAEITTSILEPAHGLVLQKQVDRIEGEGTVQIPGLKKGFPARLRVEAKAGKGDAVVEESLQVAEPTHASHVALSKSTYFIGENLFFRTLTLDRFTLKPPATPLRLRFTLLDSTGRVVREMPGQTDAGGVSCGEWALESDMVSGKYTFQVAAGEGTSAHVVPQQRALEIVRGETPQIEFDRDQYKPGDTLGFNFRAGGQAGNSIYANKDINITVNADDQPVLTQALNAAANQAATQNSARLDNEGNLNNYQLQLPPKIKNRAELVIDMKDGKLDNKLVQAIPVLSSERTIDFFPEGGELVAGLPNRVYYRVRSPQGESVDAEGHVIVLAGKVVIQDSERRRGLGSFTFIPDPKETYSVRITGSQGVTQVPNPFQKLGILSQGLILHAPQSVGREGDPLPLLLRVQGAARRLLLQTTCRGQIVDQRYLDLQPGSQLVDLPPAPGAAGILRVTALDASGGPLVPLAERLLYRLPATWLDLSCQIANGHGPYPPGTKNIAMKLKVVDEQKNAGPVWMLAAVVDEKYRAEKYERSLASHFYLAGDLGGEELDKANLVLNDTPASREDLDLFLGTQGWRRFVRGETTALLALNEANEPRDAKGASAPESAFFSLQNSTTQNLQDNYQTALQKETRKLIDRANRERANLAEQRDVGIKELDQAARELAEFQQLPGAYFRLGLGILTLVLFAAGGVFLTAGLLRLIRKRVKSPTVCFAGAFSCLFACFILYLTAMPPTVGNELAAEPLAALQDAAWPPFTPDNVKLATATTPAAPMPPSPPLGYFVAQAATPAREKLEPRQPSALRSAGTAGALAKRGETMLLRAQSLGVNQFLNTVPGDPQRQIQESMKGNEEMQRRFAQNAAKAKDQVRGPQAPIAKPAAGDEGRAAFGAGVGGGGGFGGGKKAGADAPSGTDNYFREYAHRGIQQPGRPDLQDTLLWSPVLISPDGQAQVSFDLSQNLTTYRILVYANSPSGRLGFYEGHLEVRPAPKK